MKEERTISGHPWYRYDLRVRYQETDRMGVVYHANYLNWFELGRTEWLRAMGMTYRSLEEHGLLLPVLEAELKFRQPARYDDCVAIYTRVSDYSNIKLQFESEIRRLEPDRQEALGAGSRPVEVREGELLVSGGTKHAWLNREWKPVRIDKSNSELFAILSSDK